MISLGSPDTINIIRLPGPYFFNENIINHICSVLICRYLADARIFKTVESVFHAVAFYKEITCPPTSA